MASKCRFKKLIDDATFCPSFTNSLQAKYSILPEQSEIERLEAQAFLQVRAGSSGEHCTQL